MFQASKCLVSRANLRIFSLFATMLFSIIPSSNANTECVWATGRVLCNKNQTKVIGTIVELWDLDSPQNSRITNPVDPDDKAAFTVVDDENGLWKLEGCASDHDWLPGVLNKPEFYLRLHHYCNNNFSGEFMTIFPVFRVYTPQTYDYHIEHPIVLDTPTPPTQLTNETNWPVSNNFSGSNNVNNLWAELSQNLQFNVTK